jgi:D-threo-aldose 1-dehydrogenase
VTALPEGWLRPLGGTGLTVSMLCAGGAPLGSMPGNFGYEVPEEQGIATALRVLAGPLTFLDTSNRYSAGESERRIGRALVQAGGLPEGFVLATKVDRDDDGRFDGARVRRSLEESLERLGVDRVPLLHLHDPEHISFEAGMAADGPVQEMLRIRDEGLAEHLGVAGGPVDLMRAYVETGAFEVLLTHNRYTLVDRSADALITAAAERGVAVLNAAVYGGGILARGTGSSTRYAYQEAPPEVLDAVRGIERLCTEFDVPLATAAVQFSTRDPRIASTVIGFSRPERVDQAVEQVARAVPEEFWAEVERLVPSTRTWLDPDEA